jgi:hypothetical protein
VSRFENAVGATDLYRMADALADAVIERHRRRLGKRCKHITLDFDPTDDPTHGQQEFTFFHGYYDTYCYLPLIGTMQFNGESEQYLLCAVLRPGNCKAWKGLVPILSRVLTKLRTAFPKSRIRVRLDGAFGNPEVLDFLDEASVEYVVGLPSRRVDTENGTVRGRRIPLDGSHPPSEIGKKHPDSAVIWPIRGDCEAPAASSRTRGRAE